ncbi:MAG: SDR family oxidoreductase [Patescibacteria group bacterium]|nr:SDR family oxidoreductase [Patescibacteria group bacterium]
MLKIMLTGATGAVGSELLPRLLSDGYMVFCIIRPKGGKTASERLAAITLHHRAIAVDGDITKHGCGVDLHKLPQRVDKFIHCAADVRFDDRFAADITATNVGGTRNVIALAETLRVPELHYVGSAYVAGDAKTFDEQPVGADVTVGFARNTYEATKFVAEGIVREWRSGHTSIYRPSIVVGRSTDGVTTTFDGYYGFFKGLHRLAEKFRSGALVPKGSIVVSTHGLELPIAIQAIGTTRLNLIQCDWLADTMAGIIALPARGETYNLAHPEPMSVEDVISASLAELRISKVSVQKDAPVRSGDSQVAVIQKMVSSGLARYAPYVTHSTRFICRNAERDLGEDFTVPPSITPEFLQKTLRYAIDVWGSPR